MDTKEFEKLLLETVIPANAPLQDQASKNERLYSCAQKTMTEALFRYRKCDERSIDAFYRDKVWVSTADCMNDGFDTRLYFDKQAILDWKAQFESEDFIKDTLSFFEEGKGLPPSMAVFPGLEQMYRSISESPIQQKQSLADLFINFIRIDIGGIVEALAPITQQTLKFCCLSERIDSSAMWGLYANDETGFALAYDCRNLYSDVPPENGFKRLCSCLPIIYSESRFQVPDEYIIFLLTYRLMKIAIQNSGYERFAPIAAQVILDGLVCPDNLVPTKIALHKSNEWKREEEWRLFCSSAGDPDFTNAKHACFTLKPTALYLGRRISSIYEKILTDIARDKNILVYKMSLNDDSPSYELIPERISNSSS